MLYIECKADQALVDILSGFPPAEIVHELKGKYEVLKLLAKRSNSVAMVDEDPGTYQPPYLEMLEVQDNFEPFGLEVRLDKEKANLVVILCPRLEEWIIEAAKEADLTPLEERYNLPSSGKRLHDVINRRLDNLALLISDLIAAPSPRILKLQQLLTS